MDPAETFWNRLLEVGEYARTDIWMAVAAVVALSLTTGIFVLCMWRSLRSTQRQLLGLYARFGVFDSSFIQPKGDLLPADGSTVMHQTAGYAAELLRVEQLEARLEGLATNVCCDAEGLDARITAAETMARRLDSLQIEMNQQIAYRRDMVARLDTQIRQQCIQLTTGLLRTEGLRHAPAAEIEDLAAEVDSLNQLFETVELSSPKKII